MSPKAVKPLNALTKFYATKIQPNRAPGQPVKCPETPEMTGKTVARARIIGIDPLPSMAGRDLLPQLLIRLNPVQNLRDLGRHGLHRGHAVHGLQLALPPVKVD